MKKKIIWLTGLSGSGKTTIAKFISKKIKLKNFRILIIDGDKYRSKKKYKNNFSKKKIYENNLSIIEHIDKIYKNYDFIIVSVISPLKKTRALAKKKFGNNYYEVFVNCTISELIKRDTKKLYANAKIGKIKNLIGYNSKIKYEKSYYKKITVHTHRETLEESSYKILKKINLNNEYEI